MAKLLEVYKCEICGNIVEVVHGSGGQLVCCGKPMMLQNENTVEASHEKHIPVFEKTANGVKVKVGAVPHPMEEKHYIEWIEVLVGDKVYRQNLKAGAPAETFFEVDGTNLTGVRAYCNLHGLWRAEVG